MFFSNIAVDAVTQKDLDIFSRIIKVLGDAAKKHKSPETDNLEVECHTICRALALVFSELKYMDGSFLGLSVGKWNGSRSTQITIAAADHSWLVTQDGAIIDPYPVGFISPCPILVPNGLCLYSPFLFNLYQYDSEAEKRIREDVRDLEGRSKLLAQIFTSTTT